MNEDLGKLLGAIISGGAGNTRIAYTENSGFAISTVDTTDSGLETAIIGEGPIRIVERYETREAAEKGHAEWVARAGRGLFRVTDVGYGTLVPPQEYDVKPSPKFDGFPN